MAGPYKTFALAGVGTLGTPFAKTWSAQSRPLAILTRANGSKLSPEIASLPHITPRPVDYDSHSSLVSALKGIDVVISTLGGAGHHVQTGLIKAAKEAGVKLFVPSEFGISTPGYTEKTALVVPAKIKDQELLKEIGLPYALFFTGGFAEFVKVFTGYAQSGGKSTFAYGSGDSVFSTTSLPDIARFVFHVVTSLPADQVEWKQFRIEGDRVTINQSVALLSKKAGRDLPTEHRDVESSKAEALKGGPSKFLDWLLAITGEGKLDVRHDEVTGKQVSNSNGVYPDWNPKSLEQVVQTLDV